MFGLVMAEWDDLKGAGVEEGAVTRLMLIYFIASCWNFKELLRNKLRFILG
jgi:hypothetical protein